MLTRAQISILIAREKKLLLKMSKFHRNFGISRDYHLGRLSALQDALRTKMPKRMVYEQW